MPALKILAGDIFGRLTVVDEAPKRGRERTFLVRCHCGTEKVAFLSNLRSGKTTTCGCGQSHPTHGQWRSPTWRSWAKMVSRCTSADPITLKNYRDRGISIDHRWRQFENFLADMGERPPGKTIERIDNEGNYNKDNCRWATRAEQMRNTRRTRFVVVDGKRMCLMDAARLIGAKYDTIYAHATRRQKSFQSAVEFYLSRRSA